MRKANSGGKNEGPFERQSYGENRKESEPGNGEKSAPQRPVPGNRQAAIKCDQADGKEAFSDGETERVGRTLAKKKGCEEEEEKGAGEAGDHCDVGVHGGSSIGA